MNKPFVKHFAWLGVAGAVLVAGQAFSAEEDSKGRQRRSPDAPEFKVDAEWPKALPNQWLIGQVAGIAVDRHDHIWIIQRPRSLTDDEAGAAQNPPRSECCFPAPSVMQFDRKGNLLRAWGGPADPGFLTSRCTPAGGCEWPTNEHGIFVDHNDNVWIAGNGGPDHQVLKFSSDGTFLLQIGKAGLTGGSNATNGAPNGTPLLGNPADVEVDASNNEAYIADGYQNKRVLVVDGNTGKYKRHWGAYGSVPNDADPGPYIPGQPPALQFRNPVHCVRVTNDALVYVCDRVNNRIQVFQTDGRFVKEFFIDRATLGNGSAWDLDTSPAVALQCRRREQPRLDPGAPIGHDRRYLRSQRSECGAVPLGPQPCRRLARKYLYRRGRHGQAGPEVHAHSPARPLIIQARGVWDEGGAASAPPYSAALDPCRCPRRAEGDSEAAGALCRDGVCHRPGIPRICDIHTGGLRHASAGSRRSRRDAGARLREARR